MSREITDTEWADAASCRSDSRWQDVLDSEIEACDVLLAHMEASEYQYYLPAYTTVRGPRLRGLFLLPTN
jgi:hypothetical protein